MLTMKSLFCFDDSYSEILITLTIILETHYMAIIVSVLLINISFNVTTRRRPDVHGGSIFYIVLCQTRHFSYNTITGQYEHLVTFKSERILHIISKAYIARGSQPPRCSSLYWSCFSERLHPHMHVSYFTSYLFQGQGPVVEPGRVHASFI